jgi:protein gp37
VWTGEVRLVEKALDLPLRWRKPRRIFVNSLSDLFHENVPDEWIARVFAVMALAPQHTFQVLTKRAKRMREWVSDPATPGRVARAVDRIDVARAVAAMPSEEIRPLRDFPGYFASDRGRVLSGSGSAACLFCGGPVDGIATKAYCSKKCRQNACYYRRVGKQREGERALVEMSPDVGEQGHRRVMLYRGGQTFRELVHRLVLMTFDRDPIRDEQACHRDGDPANNALPNLRWGSQSDNWTDRKRHGNGGPSDFAWPLPNVWKGTSCEDQAAADERVPLLLQTPAAVRFVSAEPLLGDLDLRRWLGGYEVVRKHGSVGQVVTRRRDGLVDWVICGGESGPGARPCDVAWIRSIVEQCKAASVPVFVKQLGSRAYDGDALINGDECLDSMVARMRDSVRDRKGADPSEWSPDLRVQEFPMFSGGAKP